MQCWMDSYLLNHKDETNTDGHVINLKEMKPANAVVISSLCFCDSPFLSES